MEKLQEPANLLLANTQVKLGENIVEHPSKRCNLAGFNQLDSVSGGICTVGQQQCALPPNTYTEMVDRAGS